MNQLSEASQLKQYMQQHIQSNCLLTGKDFALSSGSASSYYFDCKKATLDGLFLNYFAKYVCEHLVPKLSQQPEVVGGLTLGADFITSAITMYSMNSGGSITQGSIVRKEPKKHGTKSKIENELNDKNILVVEDVITSGASIAKACDEFLAAGYNPVALLTLVDRESGAMEFLQEKYGTKLGIDIVAIFSASEFTI